MGRIHLFIFWRNEKWGLSIQFYEKTFRDTSPTQILLKHSLLTFIKIYQLTLESIGNELAKKSNYIDK